MTPGVVVHVTSGSPHDWSTVLRNLGNLLDAGSDSTPPAAVAVVVHGEALPMAMAGSPVADAVAEWIADGVSVRACANTLAGRDEDETVLLDGVSVVPSGVAEVVRLEREGWAYLKLP